MKIVGKNNEIPNKFEDIVKLLQVEKEKMKQQESIKERMHLEKKIEKLERELKFNNERRGRFGFRKQIKCYRCKRFGHVARYCQNKEVKKDSDYFLISWLQNFHKRRKTLESKTLPGLDDMIEKYHDVFKDIERVLEFCPVEKCKFETQEGKILVKKGALIPQSKEEQAGKYMKDLLNRKIIRKSNSQWCNPIRFVEIPDGNLRLVCNFIALNDIVLKDPYSIPSMREIYAATQGYKRFTIVAYYYMENDKEKTALNLKDSCLSGMA